MNSNFSLQTAKGMFLMTMAVGMSGLQYETVDARSVGV